MDNLTFLTNAIIAYNNCNNECKSYHTAWSLLRSVNMIGGIHSDKKQFLNMFKLTDCTKPKNILITGCADTGIAEVVTEYFGNIEYTILDKCISPLTMCQNTFREFNITYVKSDILQYQTNKKYDLIISHSFLLFFEKSDIQNLFKLYGSLLSDNGSIILSSRFGRTNKSIYSQNDNDNKSIQAKSLLSKMNFKDFAPKLVDKTIDDFYDYFKKVELPFCNMGEIEQELAKCKLFIQEHELGGTGKFYSSFEQNNQPKSIVFKIGKKKRV